MSEENKSLGPLGDVANVCPWCGLLTNPYWKFCPKCGGVLPDTKLEEEQAP